MEEDLARLKELNERLTKLFADPHPGLFMWMQLVAQTVEDMAKIVGYRPKRGE